MFSVLADGSGRYRLEDGTGANVGWIRGRAIGFRGLRNDAEAIVAASAGWRAMQTLLRREYAAWPRQEVEWERLRFVWDGAHEWVSDGRIPLARVFRTSQGAAQGRAGAVVGPDPTRQYAVEFVVPSWLSEVSAIPVARALWRALEPLLAESPHATRTARPESHPEWRPATTAAMQASDEMLVG